jgi:hypothetical protein
MKKREIKDLGASVRARLTNIAKETKRRSRLESYKTFDEAINHMELFLEPICSRQSFSSGDQFRWGPEKWKWK